ncbi:unnamed protein product [Chrysoparadoxa australica]
MSHDEARPGKRARKSPSPLHSPTKLYGAAAERSKAGPVSLASPAGLTSPQPPLGAGPYKKSKEKSEPRRWTAEEDKRLQQGVKDYGEANWKAIAQFVATRNHSQCLQRWKKVLCPGLKKGQWTAEEDSRLLALVNQGFKNWGLLAEHMPGRISKQCRERWCHHLDPNIRKGNFTEEEEAHICAMQQEVGNKWAQIAQTMEGRTENAVKIRWKAIQNSKKHAENGKPRAIAVRIRDKGEGSASPASSTPVSARVGQGVLQDGIKLESIASPEVAQVKKRGVKAPKPPSATVKPASGSGQGWLGANSQRTAQSSSRGRAESRASTTTPSGMMLQHPSCLRKRIGAEFQAEIPELTQELALRIWHPSMDQHGGAEIASTQSSGLGSTAVELVLMQKYQAESEGLASHERLAKAILQQAKACATWDPVDAAAFRRGIFAYRRYFQRIQSKYLPHKSVREIISYYYRHWKQDPVFNAWDSMTLVGRHICKHEEGIGILYGVVKSFYDVKDTEEPEDLFRVRYEDGGSENFFRNELEPLLVAPEDERAGQMGRRGGGSKGSVLREHQTPTEPMVLEDGTMSNMVGGGGGGRAPNLVYSREQPPAMHLGELPHGDGPCGDGKSWGASDSGGESYMSTQSSEEAEALGSQNGYLGHRGYVSRPGQHDTPGKRSHAHTPAHMTAAPAAAPRFDCPAALKSFLGNASCRESISG